MNEVDSLAQPQCPKCDTVLRDTSAGYHCTRCGLLYLRNTDFTGLSE